MSNLPSLSYANLRLTAINAAQAASGKIWTDYNDHDPGVTLLEQTCFALTNVAYHLRAPTRDLLTPSEGGLALAQQPKLYRADAVLSDPLVTLSDIANHLRIQCGLSHLELFDSEQGGIRAQAVCATHSQDAEARLRQGFSKLNLLGIHLNKVEIQKTQPAYLAGEIELRENTNAMTTLRALFVALEGADLRLPLPVEHLNQISGVDHIHHLHVLEVAQPGPLRLVTEGPEALDAITLTQTGRTVELPPDFHLHVPSVPYESQRPDPLRSGRHRPLNHGHVDGQLPIAYSGHGYDPQLPSLTTAYRCAIDHTVASLTKTIEASPHAFGAEGITRERLDYRLALHGEAMPDTAGTALHAYNALVSAEQHALDLRLAFLDFLGGHRQPVDRLRLLIDMVETPGPQCLNDWGLNWGSPDAQGTAGLSVAHDPFATCVPVQPAPPLAPGNTFWHPSNLINPQNFLRAGQAEAFVLLTNGSDWAVTFEEALLICGGLPHDQAVTRLHQIRATWQAIHRSCEYMEVLENRANRQIDLIFPGWTIRTSKPAYRAYVASQTQESLPVGYRVHIHWLTPHQSQTFAALDNPQRFDFVASLRAGS